MTIKRCAPVFALLALLAAVVSAGDEPGPKGYAIAGYWHSGPSVLLAEPLVQEATGLDGESLRLALLDGGSLNELIAANDGDAEGVIAALAGRAAETIHLQAAAVIDGLEASFTEAMEESQRRRFPWWRRHNPLRDRFGAWGMSETIAQATGLAARELNEALLEGSTIAELIESNGGDVAATVATLVTQATDGINEAAAARIERSEEALVEVFEADFSDSSRRWRNWRPRTGAFFSFRGVYDSGPPVTADNGQQALGEPADG